MINKMTGRVIRNAGDSFELWRKQENSRKEAIEICRQVTEQKGHSVMTPSLLKQIKRYCKKTFGSSRYWPWIVLYTEIRGEYKEGWVPDDFYKYVLAEKLNKPSSPLLSALKSFDHRLFPGFAVKPLFVKIGKNYFNADGRVLNSAELSDIISSHSGELVVKRDSGPSGTAVTFIDASIFDISTHLSKHYNYVIQPAVEQHPAIAEVYDKSVNTLRVVTLIKPGGSIGVLVVFMRFGVNGSRLDNIMTGGRFVAINQDGTLEGKAYDRLGLYQGETQPDTGFHFAGLKVPSYRQAIQQCIYSHTLYPYNRLIAWDVYINTDEEPRLIEWNSLPGLWRYEAVFGPLWDSSILAF